MSIIAFAGLKGIDILGMYLASIIEKGTFRMLSLDNDNRILAPELSREKSQ